jgi:hypothetical protein
MIAHNRGAAAVACYAVTSAAGLYRTLRIGFTLGPCEPIGHGKAGVTAKIITSSFLQIADIPLTG